MRTKVGNIVKGVLSRVGHWETGIGAHLEIPDFVEIIAHDVETNGPS